MPDFAVTSFVEMWVRLENHYCYFSADFELLGNAAPLRQGEAENPPVGPLNLNSSAIDEGNRMVHPRCVTVFRELLDHTLKIGIASAKDPREPVPTPLGNSLAVHDHLELTSRARYSDGFNAKALLDEGHEPRDLGPIVLPCRAVNDFDLHSGLAGHQFLSFGSVILTSV